VAKGYTYPIRQLFLWPRQQPKESR
jgi:hypothetical protein